MSVPQSAEEDALLPTAAAFICRCPRAKLEPVSAQVGLAFWEKISPISLRETVTGAQPAQATQVRTAWDESGWRVHFEMDDAHPWATLTQRDGQLWTEEAVEVFFDPIGDLESYFEVEINPLGTVTDLVLRRVASGWRKNFAWHVEGLGSQVKRTSAGWCAELAIPFTALGPEHPVVGTQWRVNFLRIDRPNGSGSEAELSAWSPTGMRNFHRPAQFGILEFVD